MAQQPSVEASQIWSLLSGIGSISGLVSAIYLVVSKVLERPRLAVSVDACYPLEGKIPTTFAGMKLTLRNRGPRATSIEELELQFRDFDTGRKLFGFLLHLSNMGKTAKSCLLPITIKPDDPTIRLEALFILFGVINEVNTECDLTIKSTHKTLTTQCVCSSLTTPLHSKTPTLADVTAEEWKQAPMSFFDLFPRFPPPPGSRVE